MVITIDRQADDVVGFTLDAGSSPLGAATSPCAERTVKEAASA
jgi:hypothetical protein